MTQNFTLLFLFFFALTLGIRLWLKLRHIRFVAAHRAAVPPEFRRLAAFDTEYLRNVAHLYPRYEQKAFSAAVPKGR